MSKYHNLSNCELTALLRDDDREAFAEIYNRYKSILQHHIYKKLGNFEEVKDVLQELFTQLWTKRKELPETINLSGYLYVAVRNKAFNIIAHRNVSSRYVQSLQEFINESNYVTDLQIREKEFAEMIDQEINALPIKMQMVFKLSRKGYLSHKEIAEQLKISEQTVSKQITNALKILKVKLNIFFFFFF
jgi:RNA polymerase sigma-70 factor (family 1)